MATQAMIEENRQLVTNAPVEFEKEITGGSYFKTSARKITNHFRGICRIYPTLIKENRRMSTCNLSDSQTRGS